jgi:hypothetical protein
MGSLRMPMQEFITRFYRPADEDLDDNKLILVIEQADDRLYLQDAPAGTSLTPTYRGIRRLMTAAVHVWDFHVAATIAKHGFTARTCDDLATCIINLHTDDQTISFVGAFPPGYKRLTVSLHETRLGGKF